MKTHISVVVVCLAAWLACSGCGTEGVTYLIRPIPSDMHMRESVIQSDSVWATARVAVIDVSGLISNARAQTMFGGMGENPVSLLAEKLDMAKNDASVKAVVLRINSPGGTVAASETMYEQVKRFRKDSGKPVVVCITDLGASGGYFVACSADQIICQPSSIVGSIGVIIQTVSFAGTMKLLGISADAIISGPMKSMGSPLKDMNAEERKIFQAMVDDFYGEFIKTVAAARPKLTIEKVRAMADGRVYTGRQALELGLVDKLGGMPDALDAAKKAAGVTSVKVVMYDRPYGYRSNVYSAAPMPVQPQVNLINIEANDLLLLRRPSFLYLWSSDLKSETGN
jgi:protease IV